MGAYPWNRSGNFRGIFMFDGSIYKITSYHLN
jgi:hypothetical protein